MKTSEVCSILKVSRHHVKKLLDDGKIKGRFSDTGRWDYDSNSVFDYCNSKNERKNVIYVRVRFNNDCKKSLNEQVSIIQHFCNNQGIEISSIYKDVSNPLDFERKELTNLLYEVLDKKIAKVFVLSESSFSVYFFSALKKIFNMCGTEIVSVFPQPTETELYKEAKDIISLLDGKLNEKNIKKLQEKLDNYCIED